jgi:hypothetical protein
MGAAGIGGAAGAFVGVGGGKAGGIGGSRFYCGQHSRPLEPLPPDILILLDRSGSMDNDINDAACLSDDGGSITGCGARSKWALMTPVLSQVVAQTESSVNWGLKFFADPGSSTCNVSNTAQVPLSVGNGAAIAAAIAAQTNAQGGISNGSRTPTNAAEKSAIAYLSGVNDLNPKFILLATDGLPDCLPGGASTTDDDSAGAIGAVRTAFNSGIATFVVGIATAGMGTADATLSQMAIAGGYPRSGSPSYYPVSTQEELTTTLSALVDSASGVCTFALGALPTSDAPISYDRITVFVDGASLSRDVTHTQGWDYADPTHTSITVSGDICNDVTSGVAHEVTIAFLCIDV